MQFSAPYYGVVLREGGVYQGPGHWTFYQSDGTPIGDWPCITGDKELDPKVRGGIIPGEAEGVFWLPVDYDIRKRKRPAGSGTIVGCRIAPVGDISQLGKRTFMLDDLDAPELGSPWPFWVHPGRHSQTPLPSPSSTGCIAIYEDWSGFESKFNELISKCRFPIFVRDL